MYEPYYQSLNIPSIVWSDKETISKMTEDSGLFNDYIKRANTEFILGTRSLDKDWDAYLKELKDMGLKDYLTVLRKYYGAK
jgi:putative aldouronate transport system substrate-binding protein